MSQEKAVWVTCGRIFEPLIRRNFHTKHNRSSRHIGSSENTNWLIDRRVTQSVSQVDCDQPQPFSEVEQAHFKVLVTYLLPNAMLLSVGTIRTDALRLFDEERIKLCRKLLSMIENCPSPWTVGLHP